MASESHHLLATSSSSGATDTASRSEDVDLHHVSSTSSNTDARAALTARVTAQQRTHVRCI
eukprot:4232-Heterococcus_DN1.PRE.4